MECITSIGTGNPLGIYQCVMVGHIWHSSKYFHLQHFSAANPMVWPRQRCLCHTLDFGIRSSSPSEFRIPLFPHMTFMGARGIFTSSMDIDIIYWHQKTLKMNSLSIDKLKNVKMITWCIGWLTSNIRMPLVLAATVQTAFAGWIPIINIIIIIILVFLWEDDFIKT